MNRILSFVSNNSKIFTFQEMYKVDNFAEKNTEMMDAEFSRMFYACCPIMRQLFPEGAHKQFHPHPQAKKRLSAAAQFKVR